MGRKQKPIEFKVDDNNCFNCISHSLGADGYPLVNRDKKRQRMNRYIFQEMFGEIPENFVIRHKCDNRKCINPEHLELGTQLDNVRDMVNRNRANFFGKTTLKITDDEVKQIKTLRKQGLKAREIAKRFGIHTNYVYQLEHEEKRSYC